MNDMRSYYYQQKLEFMNDIRKVLNSDFIDKVYNRFSNECKRYIDTLKEYFKNYPDTYLAEIYDTDKKFSEAVYMLQICLHSHFGKYVSDIVNEIRKDIGGDYGRD